jgi:hypothetical protein
MFRVEPYCHIAERRHPIYQRSDQPHSPDCQGNRRLSSGLGLGGFRLFGASVEKGAASQDSLDTFTTG